MRNLLSEVYRIILSSEEAQRKTAGFERAMGTDEFQFLKDAILVIKREMMKDMLSKSHTNLTKEEKDVVQRTYFHLNEMLDFFYSPLGWVKQKSIKWPNQGGKAKNDPGGKVDGKRGSKTDN